MIQLRFKVGEPGRRLLAKMLKNGGRLKARETKAAKQITEVGLAVITQVGEIKVLSLVKVADEPLTETDALKLPS